MNTVEKVTTIHFPTKHRRETRREAHLPDESGLKTDAWEVQAHVATDHAKAVTGRRYPGAGAAAPPAAPPCLPFHMALSGGLPYDGCMGTCRETDHSFAINRGEELSHKHTPHKSHSPSSLVLFLLFLVFGAWQSL